MLRPPAPRTAALGVLAALSAAALAGCSGDAPDGLPENRPAAPDTVLSANSTAELGTTVVDGNVYTLYRSDRDSANPSTSTCVDACAADWPPMLTDPATPPVLEGIDPAVVGTVARPDGTMQVTIAGWPVYRHAADPAPGATDGNGVDGTWFAIKPDGSKAAKPTRAG